jgi:hypothetical protein
MAEMTKRNSPWWGIGIGTLIIAVVSSIGGYAVTRDRVDTLRQSCSAHFVNQEAQEKTLATVLTQMQVQLAQQQVINENIQKTLDRVDKQLDRGR